MLIEPHLSKIKFVSGNARFWLGMFKGNSDISAVVKLVDARSGETVAEEPIRGHGNGFKSTVTIGATDNLMMVNVARDMCDYVVRTVLPGHSDTLVAGDAAQASSDEDPKAFDLYGELIPGGHPNSSNCGHLKIPHL